MTKFEELQQRLGEAKVDYKISDSFLAKVEGQNFPNKRLSVKAGPYEFSADFADLTGEYFEYITKGDETLYSCNSSEDRIEFAFNLLSNPMNVLSERVGRLKKRRVTLKGKITRNERAGKDTWNDERSLVFANRKIELYEDILKGNR